MCMSEEKEETKSVVDDFYSLDKDGDGYLNKKELLEAGKTDAEATEILKGDTNGDGKMSIAEYVFDKYPDKKESSADGVEFISRDKFKEKFGNNELLTKAIYKEYDINNDGKLTKSEIAFMENLISNAKPIGENFFNLFDKDKDGYLTKEEMESVMKEKQVESTGIVKSFDAADINKDGKLSKTELLISTVDGGKASKDDFISFYGSEEGSKLFDQYDTDKDGIVITDEVKDVESDKNNGLSGWAIAGIVVAGVLVAGIVIAIIVAIVSDSKEKNNEEPESNLDSAHEARQSLL